MKFILFSILLLFVVSQELKYTDPTGESPTPEPIFNEKNTYKQYTSYTEINTEVESELITKLKNYIENKDSNVFADAVLTSERRLENQKLVIDSLVTENNIDNTCQNRRKEGTVADVYYFAPNLMAKLINLGDKVQFENTCFKQNIFSLIEKTDNEIHLELEASEPNSLLCSDYYLITTSRIHELQTVFKRGIHKIVLKNLSQNDFLEIKANGIRVLGFCQDVIQSLKSLYDTIKLYLGGITNPHVPDEMEKANVDFIKRYVGYDFQPRGEVGKTILNIDKKDIHTGDFVAIVRLDGLDELIMMGTGSSIGHTAVCIWIDNELYVVESQDGWYWPKHGIQRNKFDDWIQNAHAADFNVVIVPLKEEYRNKLNVDKVMEWFRTVEGLNYGYHNFLFGWVDTAKNFPKFIDYEIAMPLFSIVEKLAKTQFDLIIGEALNQRVETKGLSLQEVLVEGSKRNLSFEQIIMIPEIQGWKYSDGENFVCCAFCIGFYKAGGLFGDLTINSQEFSPKDVYQLSFFNANYDKPQICKDADPNTPFCQIIGHYRVVFSGVGTIEPYNNMNERCPSQYPEFIRPDGC